MKPYRSLLFVPGHKRDWIDKALNSEADAIIIDLEDSVPRRTRSWPAPTRVTRSRPTTARRGSWSAPTPWTPCSSAATSRRDPPEPDRASCCPSCSPVTTSSGSMPW